MATITQGSVRNCFGMVEGHAFWCMMPEWLTEQDGLEWELSDLELEMFSCEIGMDPELVNSMIELSLKIGLLSKTDSGFIYSESLNENLEPVFKKRQKNREASKDRKRKENGKFSIPDGLHPDDKSFHPDDKSFHPDEIPQSKVKNSKEKDSKEKDKEIPGFSAKNPVVETDLLKDLPAKA